MVREKVKAGAAWYIYSIQELIDELEVKEEPNPGPGLKQNLQVVVGSKGGAFGKAFFGYQAERPNGVKLGSSPTTLTAN